MPSESSVEYMRQKVSRLMAAMQEGTIDGDIGAVNSLRMSEDYIDSSTPAGGGLFDEDDDEVGGIFD